MTETTPASARGTGLILCSLLEARGDEEDVKAQSTVLVGKLYSKLRVMARQAEGEEAPALAGALDAARIAASHNPKVLYLYIIVKTFPLKILRP